MIYSEIKTDLSSAKIWDAWKRAFESKGNSLTAGEKGKGVIRFEILEVIEGKSYTILWKSFLTKILYTYRVFEAPGGSSIRVTAKPKGFYFWIVRLTSKKKIQKELDLFLQSFVNCLRNC